MTDPDRRPVLLAVGPDGDFDAALHLAAREATTRNATMLLLHAYHVLPTGPETATIDFAPVERVATARLREATGRARTVLAGQVEVVPHLSCGPVVASIVDAAARCSLVVLQRRDLSHVERIVTRSTSSGVAARAHCPVVVVPSGWTATEPGDPGVVVVGIDVPARGRSVLQHALDEARSRRSALKVVHTWWSPGYFDDVHMDAYASRAWTAEATDEIRGLVDELQDRGADHDVPVEIETSHGRPADVLVDASRTARLLVVGRHDPWVPYGSHLGPVARGVLRAAHCPVLLVSPTGARRHDLTAPVDAAPEPS